MSLVALWNTVLYFLYLFCVKSGGFDITEYEGRLIQRFLHSRDKNPPIYIVYNTTKLFIPNQAIFNQLKLNNSDIYHLPLWKINSIPSGPILEPDSFIYTKLLQNINVSKEWKDRYSIKPTWTLTLTESNTIKIENENVLAINPTTLIIVYGQYRTFDQTCHSIFQYIVQVNLPAIVVLSFDDDVLSFDEEAIQCLSEYKSILPIYILKGKIRKKLKYPITKEFILVDRALDYVYYHKTRLNIPDFYYILKVRSDNYIQIPISVAICYANHTNFFTNFLDFESEINRVYKLYYGHKASYHDILYGWILTGGMKKFIQAMLITPNPSPWCLINSTVWNRNIKEYIYHHIPQQNRISYYHYYSVVKKAIQDIHQKFIVLYLIGSTWIHFGQTDQIRQISYTVLHNFGSFKWNVSKDYYFESNLYSWPIDPPFNQMKSEYYPNEWTDITESQLRLSHWKYSYNLVDIVNVPDYMNTFAIKPNASLLDDVDNPQLAVWLLRTCDRHPHRAECKPNNILHP